MSGSRSDGDARRRWSRRVAGVLLGVVTLVGAIALGYGLVARNHPDLKPWHTIVPEGEPSAEEMDAGMDLAAYLAREDAVLRSARARIEVALAPADDVAGNRYAPSWAGNPARLAVDWNRSYERVPDSPRGAVLLVHGMTDGPYSMRALATRMADEGWHVLALRLPGHGSAPAALLQARWEDWAAAVRLGLRHLHASAGVDRPLVAVGYSTGAALLVHHALLSIDDPTLPRMRRLVLLSPLVGLTRGAGLAPVLSALDRVPGFEKAAWLDVQPEYNPFKYNSFPVNGGWQSHRLVVAVGESLERLRDEGQLDELPPLLTFHSVLDTTVLSDAVIAGLYDRLPANGSELVMYDVNRWGIFVPLFKSSQLTAIRELFRSGPRAYALRVVTNRDPGTLDVHEIGVLPGARETVQRDLGAAFPQEVYSLSHTAVPFPCDDPLYGIAPRTDEDYGVRLGTLALRGERGALQVPMEQLARLNCNPFFDDLVARVLDWVGAPIAVVPAAEVP